MVGRRPLSRTLLEIAICQGRALEKVESTYPLGPIYRKQRVIQLNEEN